MNAKKNMRGFRLGVYVLIKEGREIKMREHTNNKRKNTKGKILEQK